MERKPTEKDMEYLDKWTRRSAIAHGISDERLIEICNAERDGRCVVYQKGYPVMSHYYKDEDGLYIREVSGVVSKEEYESVLEKEQNKNWIDNADSYICPDCGFETNNPNKLENKACPKCGFVALKDLSPEAKKLYHDILTGEFLKENT